MSKRRGRLARRRQAALRMLAVCGAAVLAVGSAAAAALRAVPAQATNADSLRFAGLIARGFADNGASLRGETGVRYLYFHGDNDERRVFEASDTTVSTDPTFGVLQYSDCPAVLVEALFLTNSADAAAYAGEEGCRTAAQIYYEAICAYFDLEPR